MNAIADTPATDNAQAFMLPPTGAIEVSGSDARAFLQGQLTNDIRKVGPQMSQLSAWCNPQGRVITSLRVVEIDDSFLLLLPADQTQHVAERLRKFVIRAKVRIDAPAGGLPGIGLCGKTAMALLAQDGWRPPTLNNAASAGDVGLLIRVDATAERFELYTRSGSFHELAAHMRVNVADDGSNAWRAWNIEAGLPVVYTANRERFLPQMLNLDCVDAISFAKGCYAGQEIVARTQNLGRIKRRMRRFRIEVSSVPGDAVFAGGSPAGHIVEMASRNSEMEILAVVPTSIDDDAFAIEEDGAPDLHELTLPYSTSR